jgi:hypothetical protein
MKNGRCRMHGGKSVSPLVTGRGAAYAQIFGSRYAALAADPDLLKADAELKLFDMFLIERAEVLRNGFSSAWIDDLKAVAETIEQAAKQADAQAMKTSLARLKELAQQGGDRQTAWGEALAAAKQRADIAAKADANVAKREQTVADRDIAAMMCRWLEITARLVDADTSRRVYAEFRREIIGPTAGLRSSGGEGAIAADRGGVPAVH